MARRRRIISLPAVLLMTMIVAGGGGTALAQDPEEVNPLDTHFTVAGQVAVFNANVNQIYAESLDAERRRSNLGNRLWSLVKKQEDDGIGYAADIFLLQELNRTQAIALKNEFPGKNASQIGHAASTDAEKGVITNNTSYLHVSETAILYNSDTMKLVDGSVGYIDHAYSRSQGCTESYRLALGIPLDLDSDGESDCAKPKWKRTFYAEFIEKESGLRFAVASVHWVLDEFFSQKSYAAEMKAEWAKHIADTLKTTFPLSTAFAIGGDFNQKRCKATALLETTDDVSTSVDSANEPVLCEPNPFWTRFSSLGFVDTVFAMHGQTDERLRDQYRDGFVGRSLTQINYRKKRIDHIFIGGDTVHSAASFDLSCGVTAPYPEDRNCAKLAHPHAYSDHRIVWAFMGPVPRVHQVES